MTVGRRSAPKTCHRAEVRTSSMTIGSTGIFSSRDGGVPMLIPWPCVSARTRPGSSASTIRERL